jgi:hypothetical protein
MFDLKIDSLALNIMNAGGHEHRIRPIAARAAAIFAEGAEGYCEEQVGESGSRGLSGVVAAPVNLNLNNMTDEHAAQTIARSWLDALKLKLV